MVLRSVIFSTPKCGKVIHNLILNAHLQHSLLHIQIPMTSYVGLILCSTTVASQVTVLLRVLWGYSDATVTKV